MPTLEKRIEDGGFYIRHFFHEHNTWQVLGEGVRFLQNRGVSEGGRFSTDLFMDLWIRGLVYHGNVIPGGPRRPCPDLGIAAALRKCVAEFYRLVYAGNSAAAWKLVATSMILQENETEAAARDRFANEVQGCRMASWRLTDCRAFDFDVDFVVEQDGQPSFRATKLGAVYLRLSLKSNADSVEQHDLVQHWLYSEGHWWPWWRGIKP